MDHGRPIEFGLAVVPFAGDIARIRAAARVADETGFDLIGIQDHPYQRRFLDTLVLIGHLLDLTERVRIFPDVANLPLRPPAMLAKEAATLDLLSGGRFELGLGAGAFWDPIAGMGGPRRVPREAVDALAEAIELIRGAWSRPFVRSDGPHYPAAGYRPGPEPAHRIEIWLGAYRPRMLALTGTAADGWIPSLGQISLDELAAGHRAIDEAARAAGREPREIRRLLNLGGAVGSEAPEGDGGPKGFGGYGAAIEGPVDEWVSRLTELATEHAVDTFIVMLPPEPDQIERFAREVIPGTRSAVAERRKVSGGSRPD